MSFKNYEGFGSQLAAAAASQAAGGAPLPPWWAPPQLLYGEPAGQVRSPAMSMSPEGACRDGQFQVVPRAQSLLDAPPPQQQTMTERGVSEGLKFSMAHGESALPLICMLVGYLQEHGLDWT